MHFKANINSAVLIVDFYMFLIRSQIARIQRFNCVDTDFHNSLSRHQVDRKSGYHIVFVLFPLSRGCLHQIFDVIEFRNCAGEFKLNNFKAIIQQII